MSGAPAWSLLPRWATSRTSRGDPNRWAVAPPGAPAASDAYCPGRHRPCGCRSTWPGCCADVRPRVLRQLGVPENPQDEIMHKITWAAPTAPSTQPLTCPEVAMTLVPSPKRRLTVAGMSARHHPLGADPRLNDDDDRRHPTPERFRQAEGIVPARAGGQHPADGGQADRRPPGPLRSPLADASRAPATGVSAASLAMLRFCRQPYDRRSLRTWPGGTWAPFLVGLAIVATSICPVHAAAGVAGGRR